MVYLVLSLTESCSMPLTIGQVANAADVNIQTIRYYERRGLFAAPKRTAAGYRQYADDAVARLRFIKHAQELGFSLREIQELLGLRVRHGAACDAIERKTRQKIEVVQQRLRRLALPHGHLRRHAVLTTRPAYSRQRRTPRRGLRVLAAPAPLASRTEGGSLYGVWPGPVVTTSLPNRPCSSP